MGWTFMLVAQTLTFSQAWELALEGPRWKAFLEELAVREAEFREGIYWENPRVQYDVEEAPSWSRTVQGLQTVGISWEIPLSLRYRYARKGWEGARRQNRFLERAQRARFFGDVMGAYLEAFFSRERYTLEGERLEVLDTLLAYTRRRLAVGRSHPAELARLEAQRSRQTLILEEARVAVFRADRTLQAYFAQPVSWERVEAPPELPPPTDTLYRKLIQALERAPVLQAAREEIRLQETLQRAATWKALPVPEVGVGQQRSPEGQFVALEVGVSLPLFDRNQAERAVRKARVRQARWAYETLRAQTLRQLEGAWEQYRHAWRHQRTLNDTILPSLERAYQGYLRGYRQGRFDLTTLLDVQEELLEAHEQLLEVKARAWEAWLEMYTILGEEVWP